MEYGFEITYILIGFVIGMIVTMILGAIQIDMKKAREKKAYEKELIYTNQINISDLDRKVNNLRAEFSNFRESFFNNSNMKKGKK